MKPVNKEIEFDGALVRAREVGKSTSTINETDGTVNGVFATEARVLSYHYEIGLYYEVLGFEPSEVRMKRIETAAPILDRHKRFDDDLGIVQSAKLEPGKLTGTLRFDLADEKGARAFRKIKDGFWKTLSIGYDVYKLRFVEDAEDGKPVYRAIDWEPKEVSTAPMPADVDSLIRTENLNENNSKIKIIHKTQNRMENKTPEQLEQERVAKENEAKNTALQAERTRVSEITVLCQKHERDADFLNKHIADGTTVDAVRTLILNDLATAQPNVKPGAREDGYKNEGERARAMEEGILFRMDGSKFPLTKGTEQNPYRHRTLMEMCDEYLQRNNLSMEGSARQRVQRAMQFGLQRTVGMTTSDFPYIFANVLNQVLRKNYDFSTGEWKEFCYKQDASRVNTAENSINLGDFTQMQKVVEGAEYKRQSVSEGKESFTAYKYGSEFSITLEMIINDDLGAINRMAQKAASMGAFTEDYIVWGLLNSNPNMADGNPVFHSSHGNLGSAAALSATTLGELYTKMRKQTGLNSKVINLKPKYVVCGPSQELVLDQILNGTFVPTAASGATPSFIKSLKPIVTAYITDNAHYLVADPNTIDTIRYGGVSGEPDFSMEEMVEMKTDSFLYHARKFFGASFTDFRGFAKNAGA